MFLDTVDRQVADTIMEHLQASDAPFRAVELRVLGGAMARVPVEATAFAHRHSRIMANVAAFYGSPADRDRRRAWVDGPAAALHQGDDGAYVNFLGDEGPERVRRAYPGRPGTAWSRSSAATTPTTCSGSTTTSRRRSIQGMAWTAAKIPDQSGAVVVTGASGPGRGLVAEGVADHHARLRQRPEHVDVEAFVADTRLLNDSMYPLRHGSPGGMKCRPMRSPLSTRS